MPSLNLSDQVDERTVELRSLRRLMNVPTQRAIEDLQRMVKKLHADVYTPEELTKLLVPIITEILRKRIAATEQHVAVTLAPVIDKVFVERTHQDKSAIVNALAPTVAKALREQHDKFPDEVAEDLAPLMGAAIREQVRLQGDAMVDALYPIIGATIAKYMAEALRQLAENVNKRIESTFSVGGLMRKAKAKAAGISEAELLLQESLPFTVRAAFLIHKSSGIVIAEAHRQTDKQFDADLVSGMLTAIRSFVNDWITRAGEVSEIDAIEYGRSKIMLEVAGHCYLAVVVDGEPSMEFIRFARETLAQIVSDSDKEIAAFQGELSFIPTSVHERVSSLLDRSVSPKKTKKPSFARSVLPLAAILLIAVAIPVAWTLYRSSQNQKTEQLIAAAVSSSLGFVNNPVAVRADGDDMSLSGTLPNRLLKQRVMSTARRVAPSAVLHDEMTLSETPTHPIVTAGEIERVLSAFNKIEGVSISSSYKDGDVLLTGNLSDETLQKKVVAAIERLPGIESLMFSFGNSKPVVDHVIYFLRSTELTEDATTKLRAIRNLMNQYSAMRVRIIGHSDATGTMAKNIPLSLARAVVVRDALAALGIDTSRLEVEGEGKPFPGIDPVLPENRSVRFEVIDSSVRSNK